MLYQISSSSSTMPSMLASSSGATRSANATVTGFATSGPGVDVASPVHRPYLSTVGGDGVDPGHRSHSDSTDYAGAARTCPGVDDAAPVHSPCPSTMRGDEVGHGRRSHHASRLH